MYEKILGLSIQLVSFYSAWCDITIVANSTGAPASNLLIAVFCSKFSNDKIVSNCDAASWNILFNIYYLKIYIQTI